MVTWWNPSIHCPLISPLLWPGCLGCWVAGWLLFYVNLAMSLSICGSIGRAVSTPSGSWWWSDQNCRLKVSFFFFFLAALITAGRPPSPHPLMNINLCVTKEVFVLIYFRRVGNKKDTGVRYRMDEMRSRKRSEPLADWFRMQTSWSSSSAASRDQLVRLLLLLLLLLLFNIISVLTRSIIY